MITFVERIVGIMRWSGLVRLESKRVEQGRSSTCEIHWKELYDFLRASKKYKLGMSF